MNAGYVCNKLKELIQDYKDAIDVSNHEIAEACLKKIFCIAREAQSEVKQRMDGVFFAGELSSNIGEKNVQYPDSVSEYRKRKRKRKDARSVKNYKERRQKRLDADDGRWVTTENDHKIHINEEGLPDKGNPFVLNAMLEEESQKTFHYERPEKQEKTLQNIIKRTANLKKEQYRIIDSDGNVVVENRGKEHEVHSKIGEKREHLEGNISIHNHPAGGTFSVPDLRDFGYGAREILATSSDGTYSLVNTRYGQKDQYDGWLDMQKALQKATPEVSDISLLQKARDNLKDCPERKRMSDIANEFVVRKDKGESIDSLREWLAKTDYNDQEESYKKKVEKERRRLEVEPFDTFFKENAEKYGFKYTFTKSSKRKDERLDAEDDDGRWVTTENDHKIHINEEGVPDKGNPHVLSVMNSGTKTREQLGRAKVDRIRGKINKGLESYKKADEAVKKSAEEYQSIFTEYKRTVDHLDAVDRVYKKDLEKEGIKEGDREKLAKEVEELEKKKNESPYYDRDITAQYNSKSFLLAEYNEVYSEETKEMRRNLPELKKKNDSAKKELDKHLRERKDALSEIQRNTERNVQSFKFYDSEERQKIKDDFLNNQSFASRMSDDDREKLSASIDKASDAQLSLLKKTFGKARMMNVEETVKPDECSHYSPQNGIMYIEKEDMSRPEVFFHEYGHFMDDFGHSGLEYSLVHPFAEGTTFEGSSKSFSDVLRSNVKLFGKDCADDLQEMMDGVSSGKFKIKTNDQEDFVFVTDAQDDSPFDFGSKTSFELQMAFDKVIDTYLHGGPNGGEIEEYYRSIGYPNDDERPKYEDYFEYYVTPKRKLERRREKFKGAEEEYQKKSMEFYDRQEAVRKEHPDFYDRVNELYGKRAEREKHIAPVCDCLCAAFGGEVFSIYGCHGRDYYRRFPLSFNEWSANIHQMMFSGDKEAIDLMSKLMPRTMKKVKKAYNEYLWRNLA